MNLIPATEEQNEFNTVAKQFAGKLTATIDDVATEEGMCAQYKTVRGKTRGLCMIKQDSHKGAQLFAMVNTNGKPKSYKWDDFKNQVMNKGLKLK